MTNQFEYTPDQYLSLIYHRIGLVVRTEPSTYVTNIEKQKKDFGQFFRADVLFPYLSDEIALQYSALMKPKEELLPYWKTDPKGSCLPTLLLGVSGSGKTHTITEYGAQGFILYFTAAMRPQDKDFYSTFMVGMVEKEMNSVALTPTDYTNGIQLSDKKEKIGAKVIQFFLFLKLAALLCLLKKYPNMTPGMFFFDQLNGRSEYYLQLMYQC
ncbi:transcription initiation factor TFIID subunit, partial [Acrasis kona]